MSDAQERRLALNEAMFREINERLESRIQTFDGGRPGLSIICECADPDCVERLTLAPQEYATARSDGRQFVVAPGHEILQVEEIVARNDRYEIVRKQGIAGQVAEQLGDDLSA